MNADTTLNDEEDINVFNESDLEEMFTDIFAFLFLKK